MATCVKAVQQSDGSFLLALDPVATDLTTCAYVVESGQESMWAFLSVEDASTIAGAIIALWAIAWSFRTLAHSFFNPSERNHDE